MTDPDINDWFDLISQFGMPHGRHLGDSVPKEKSPHDFDHDGTIVEYLGGYGRRNFALSLGDRYIPFAKDADRFEDEYQIVGVYDYPVDDINKAFWDQAVDRTKLKPLWKKDFTDYKKKIDSIDKRIRELQEQREMYNSFLPKDIEFDKKLKN